jgi:hypothetical protein
MPAPIAVASPRQAAAIPWPIPASSFDSPDGSSEGRAGVRVGVFLLPLLLEALWREDALLRLREGEDARVAMNAG